MKAKPPIYIFTVILASCLILIVTGSPILNRPLNDNSTFPLGTFISWIGIIALTLTVYFAFIRILGSKSSKYRILRFVFKSIIVLASIWGFIGFILADNWAFTFQNHDKFRGSIDASRYFWIYTASLVLLPIIIILIFLLMYLSGKLIKKSNTDT